MTASGGAGCDHFSNTFFTCPIFFWTVPASCSTWPSVVKSGSLVNFPAVCFALPFTSCRMPSTWSFVLGFMMSPFRVEFTTAQKTRIDEINNPRIRRDEDDRVRQNTATLHGQHP